MQSISLPTAPNWPDERGFVMSVLHSEYGISPYRRGGIRKMVVSNPRNGEKSHFRRLRIVGRTSKESVNEASIEYV